MRRCVWYRNLKNEEVMARVVQQRHRKKAKLKHSESNVYWTVHHCNS